MKIKVKYIHIERRKVIMTYIYLTRKLRLYSIRSDAKESLKLTEFERVNNIYQQFS